MKCIEYISFIQIVLYFFRENNVICVLKMKINVAHYFFIFYHTVFNKGHNVVFQCLSNLQHCMMGSSRVFVFLYLRLHFCFKIRNSRNSTRRDTTRRKYSWVWDLSSISSISNGRRQGLLYWPTKLDRMMWRGCWLHVIVMWGFPLALWWHLVYLWKFVSRIRRDIFLFQQDFESQSSHFQERRKMYMVASAIPLLVDRPLWKRRKQYRIRIHWRWRWMPRINQLEKKWIWWTDSEYPNLCNPGGWKIRKSRIRRSNRKCSSQYCHQQWKISTEMQIQIHKRKL